MPWQTATTFVLISILGLGLARADNPCEDRGLLIDQRTESQMQADRRKGRLRCVTFVLSASREHGSYGWVEWHHVQDDRPSSTHRLGLFPAEVGGAMAFGRIQGDIEPDTTSLQLTVLLPTHRWWLVNTTRHGWQLRSGAVSAPDMSTLRKLFTDVALNAGIADQAQRFERWWPPNQ